MRQTCFALILLVALPLAAEEAPAPPAPEPAADATPQQPAEAAPAELLDTNDPRAREGVVVGARGIDPGWKDSLVAERSPSLYGQTGILRTISARTGKPGYFDLGLHGRWFYFDDFIRPAAVDENAFFGGQLSFGVALTEFVEVALATQFATNANNSSVPASLFTTGDLLPSVKVGYAFLPYAVALDMRAQIPTAQDQVGLDAGNFSFTATGIFTYDMYEEQDVPLRVHANLGYTYQNARNSGAPESYLIPGVEGALLALTTQSWFYDQLSFGLGVEAPLPYATPFVELTTQTAIGVAAGEGAGAGDYGFGDSVVILTPGVRGSVGRGLSFDLGIDIGLAGTGGGTGPDVGKLVVGQPYNPLWAVQLGVSYTFSPFVAETQVEVREKSRAQGLVKGCVKSEGAPVLDAVVEYAGMSGPRILVDDNGCFQSPLVDVGALTVRITHSDHQPKTETVEIRKDETTPLEVELVAAPRFGVFKGTAVDEDDATVDAVVEVAQGGTVKKSAKTTGGAFEVQLPPGKYQVVVKSPGFLQQGTAIIIEPLGKTTQNFMLKRPSKTRITKVTSEKIEISSKIPFELGKDRLLKAAEFVLDDVVDVLLANPQLGTIIVEGHTDTTGEEQANKLLSDLRAAAVVDYLVEHGVPVSRLEAKGYGFSRPIASNDTEAGRAKNRRVEFVISGGSAP